MTRDGIDPKGLIREAYRIDGITPGECRSIFMDWALSLPGTAAPRDALAILLARHGQAAPDHPMTAVLREGFAEPARPLGRRRGGWRARRPAADPPAPGTPAPGTPDPDTP